MSVVVGMDYDGTYKLSPALWNKFALMARGLGWQVVGLTGNRAALCDKEFGANLDAIYFVPPGIPKERVAREKGWEVDIWIDDEPQFISEHPGCLDWSR